MEGAWLWTRLDPDSESGSTDLIESGSETLEIISLFYNNSAFLYVKIKYLAAL
jgi:hypothetical protein